MSRSIVAMILAATAAARSEHQAVDLDFVGFQAFVEKHGRIYHSPAEAAGRFAIFKENLQHIAKLNTMQSRGSAIYGVNKFSDISTEEFSLWYKGYRPTNSSFVKRKAFLLEQAQATSIDWRAKGAVTPVKNQGQCGSCWAFSATQQLESDYFLKFNQLKVLAPQQIVSCDTNDYGCNGGNPVTAYQYVSSTAQGQEYSQDYPYTSGTTGRTGTCDFIAADRAADLSAAYYVSQSANQESNMLQQIQESPMSVCVDAESWQHYQGGVVTAATCGTQIDHAVQVVGLNAEKNYWIVRNSWGTDWGNDGYIYVEAMQNACSIADLVTIVTASRLPGETKSEESQPIAI